MLIIRLQRVGRTNDPSFRVVVTDSKNAAKSGKFLETVGSYDARQGKPQLEAERIQHWIKNGAQVSATVHNLLVKAKIIDGKIIVQIPDKKVVAAPAAEPAKATAAATADTFSEVAADEVAPVTPEVAETPAVEEPKEESAPTE